MSKWISVEDAIRLIPDGSTVAFAGFASIGVAEELFKGIEQSFLKTGKPRDLTVVHAACPSDGTVGLARLAHEGLIKRIIGGHWGVAPNIGKMIAEEKIEAHCISQGQLVLLYRDMARGGPGLFSKIGLETFLDPEQEGGKINGLSQAQKGFIERITLDGQQFLHYKPIPIDFAILRGTTADEKGNISFEDEGILFENLSLAQAVKRNGGKAIFQVKNRVKNGTLNPKAVQVPANFVDYIVKVKEPLDDHRVSKGYFVERSITGDLKASEQEAGGFPLSIRKIIGRRAIAELKGGEVINAGVGLPGDTIGKLLQEEQINETITNTLESGVYGGVAQGGADFGLSQSAEAIIEHAAQFDFYNGIGVDMTFMGVAEIDRGGNVNVSKMENRIVGCGGFIDITQTAKKVIFCTTFTAGGLEIEIQPDGIKIIKEGSVKKFVDTVSQITFNGSYSSKNGVPVLYVTERAVFRLINGQLELIEIAPGIDLEQHILGQMGFMPVISPDLKQMNLRLYRTEPMGVKDKPYSPINLSNPLLKGAFFG